MFNSNTRSRLIASLLSLAVLGLSPAAFADSGPFIGVSGGNSTISADVPDPGLGGDINFDGDDFAWKVYGGYAFDFPVFDLGLEIGYFDLGSPNIDVAGEQLDLAVTGVSAFVLAGVNMGPVGLFIKGGMASWDAELALADLRAAEDGSDPAYGFGLRATFGSVEIRGEYEIFDIDNANDVYMTSLGLVWRF